MNRVFWLIVTWFVVSVTFVAVFGRVSRARDQREIPPLDQDNDGERSRHTPTEACKCKRGAPLQGVPTSDAADRNRQSASPISTILTFW
ncbi:hypothetical protein C6369_002235 [Rhodococcus rhodochrous]|nr:hypothetical protein C6369_002235 [Rhodococcus rhodochrous]